MARKTKRNKLAASEGLAQPRRKFHQSRPRPSAPVPTNQEIRATLSQTALAPSIVEVFSRSIAELPAENRRWMTEIAASWSRLVPRREGAVPPRDLSVQGKQAYRRLILEAHANYSRFTDVAARFRALEESQATAGSPDLEALYELHAVDPVDPVDPVDEEAAMMIGGPRPDGPVVLSPEVSAAVIEMNSRSDAPIPPRAMQGIENYRRLMSETVN